MIQLRIISTPAQLRASKMEKTRKQLFCGHLLQPVRQGRITRAAQAVSKENKTTKPHITSSGASGKVSNPTRPQTK